MTLGPIRRITRSESTASPGSSNTRLVSAQVRKPSSDRPACIATWRDGKHQAISVHTGELHGAGAEPGHVQRNVRLQVHVLVVVHEHFDGAGYAIVRIVDGVA